MGFLSSVLNLFSSGSINKEAQAYNNKLMNIINESEPHINNMNQAMMSANFEKAESIRKIWNTSIDSNISAVEQMGSYKGDADLQQAVLKGLNGYKKIVTDDYTKLIFIRKNGPRNEGVEAALLNNINDAFEFMGNAVNEAVEAFERKNKE